MLQVVEFNPIQPEWHKALSYYQQIQLPFPTNQHIAFMYEFEISSSAYLPGIPDACIDFIFCADRKRESNIVVASPPKRVLMKFHKNVRYTGIRLLPQQGIFNFQLPLKQLFKNFAMPLFDVTDFPYFLYEQLLTFPTLEEKADFLNSYLHKHNPSSTRDSKSQVVNACIQKIMNSQGTLKIIELEHYTGFSERYLRNIFNENLGLSPKQFIQLYRFQITIQKMFQYNSSQLAQLLNEELYYDESHFYKNFKKYVNMTPKEYAKMLKS